MILDRLTVSSNEALGYSLEALRHIDRKSSLPISAAEKAGLARRRRSYALFGHYELAQPL